VSGKVDQLGQVTYTYVSSWVHILVLALHAFQPIAACDVLAFAETAHSS
jgi:hypothetical protein